jgi:polyhydroxybutyrate depolymerase
MKKLILILFLLYSSALFSQKSESINHDGQIRTYSYYLPTNWTSNQQLPLLIVLHGLTQTGAGVMNITQFNQIAEDNNFIVCYPNGLNNAWNANMNVTISTADDKGFIETLVHHFQSNFNTNPLKQYLCGFSNGGFMSHKMACESSECFAAIATISGNMSDTTFATCNPQYTPAVLHIHGTSDAIVPYNGGASTGVSVDQTMQRWTSFLNCNTTPTSFSMSNSNLTDFSSPERITYSSCASPLELIKITGGGHQWPGISTLVGGAGTINMDFYSPQIIWDFLSSNTCQSTGLDYSSPEISIYPNPVEDQIKIKNLDDEINVTIQDYSGRIVKFATISGQNSTISLSDLNFGSYTVILTSTSQLREKQILSFIKIR